MKVGTDGVLVGAWANIQEAHSILDIGTGSGLIAIMAAQRNPLAAIDAIDIDEAAVKQARKNVNECPWKERINIQHCSLQDYANNCRTKYDAIITNPPYFHQSLPSPDRQRTIARHTNQLTTSILLESSVRLLSDTGILHVIMPVNEGEELIRIATKLSLHCIHKTIVHPRDNVPAKRLLLSFQIEESQCIEDNIAIETSERHHYSPEYILLTKDFYLNLSH
jgi:tRNA1Val (adenine37-N6)-methyltransferase